MGFFKSKDKGFYAFVSGKTIAIEEVKDDVFSSKMMGEGIAIIPNEGKLYAPCSGRVIVVMEGSQHAIGIENTEGMEILLHVGIDTVELNGEGFTPHVKVGDLVEKGELLMDFDQTIIKEKGYDDITIMIVTNTNSHTLTQLVVGQEVEANTSVIVKYK